MRLRPRFLLNLAEVEIWPADLLRARSNHHARALSQARWGIRRKHDGRYLAAVAISDSLSMTPLVPSPAHDPGIGVALTRLETLAVELRRDIHPRGARALPLFRLRERLESLGIEADDYQRHSRLPIVPEPEWLSFAGRDRYRRPLWLTHTAAGAWNRMRHAAWRDGVVLEAVSGYRSHDYQLAIFERKRVAGKALEQILRVNAAPGYSEHHSGNALDISTPGQPPVEESFEGTKAFAWLGSHAPEYGFRMSYPRDNPHGVVYEPWHWCHSTER